MLIISALIFNISLTAFVYYSLLLFKLVSQNLGAQSKFKYPVYLLRALFFRETSVKMRECAKGAWVSTLLFMITAILILASRFTWFQ